MPIKNFLYTLVIASVFWWMNTATSKEINLPCGYQLMNYLGKDTVNRIYLWTYSHDTVIFKAYKDTLLSQKSEILCSMLRDTCQIRSYKVLIIDTALDQSTWNTPFGKRLFFRQCP